MEEAAMETKAYNPYENMIAVLDEAAENLD